MVDNAKSEHFLLILEYYRTFILSLHKNGLHYHILLKEDKIQYALKGIVSRDFAVLLYFIE
jgi:hypothetical protein